MYEVRVEPLSDALWEITRQGAPGVLHVARMDAGDWYVLAPGRHHRGTLGEAIGAAVVEMANG